MQRAIQRLRHLFLFLLPHPLTAWYVWNIRQSGLFDRAFYRGVNPGMNRLFHRFPERHYAVFGEPAGLQPNAGFAPEAYLRLNTDLDGARRPFLHYVRHGHREHRRTREAASGPAGDIRPPALRPRAGAPAPFAVVAHVYYPDLWAEMAEKLAALDIAYDLFVTLADRGEGTAALADRVAEAFPAARVVVMPNHGRDVFPFVHLVNSGLLDPYRAVCKIHTKRSPHRADGDIWRRHLIAGLLPGTGTAARLDAFLADDAAAIWVADGQHYRDDRWWSVNREATTEMLGRVEVRPGTATLAFPAGSMYWLKPLMLAMIRGMMLDEGDFEPEEGQVDGTRAHAFERAVGFLPGAAGMAVRETSELDRSELAPDPDPGPPATAETAPAPAKAGVRPSFVSAFYLPQFHRTAENDAWWGRGFTEWQAAARARPMFPGHAQPALPGELGFYDLRLAEVMGEQAALAREAGIDAFCVHHYWFDGRRILEAPLDNLLKRPEIDFPFYLCWANESWRRNWDGLSGEVLLEQSYAEGFEEALAEDTLPYLADPRYLHPDGRRPRFVIYRPDDLPDPPANIANLRTAWTALGLGEVELGAVRFHLEGAHPVDPDLFDFWIEMPPHGLVDGTDFLLGGPDGNRLGVDPAPGFKGLVYDYAAVIANSLDPAHAARLPADTIAGAMPAWDNTARRGRAAHIAFGANPAAFRRWLDGLSRHRLAGSYRGELMLNAWNEWAEKAVMEPDRQYARARLDVLRAWRGGT